MEEKQEWFQTLEEFVEWELRANKGSSVKISKEVVCEMFKELYPNVKVKGSMTKGAMIDEILKKKSLLDIYNENKDKFGIKPHNWIEKFNLTPAQRKKMETKGYLLHVVYSNYEKVFTGTYANVPYYKAEDYFNHTPEEVEKWKEDNIRGYKKRKEAKKHEIKKDIIIQLKEKLNRLKKKECSVYNDDKIEEIEKELFDELYKLANQLKAEYGVDSYLSVEVLEGIEDKYDKDLEKFYYDKIMG